MSDAREVRTSDGRTLTAAQVAAHEGILRRLTWPSLHWGVEGVHSDAWPHIASAAADAILAAGWTPPTVKPSVEDVARAILMVTQAADVDPDYAWNVQYPEVQDECLDQARAVLALLPGRTETEVRREAWDEVADYLDRTNAPSLAEAARRDNPYRKEADRG